MPAQRMASFFLRLRTMTAAGVPMAHGISLLARQEDEAHLARTFSLVASHMYNGRSMSDSMAMYPEVFNRLSCALVRVGESGSIVRAFDEVTRTLTQQAEVEARVVQAVRYPALVAVVSVCLTFAMFRWVLPAVVIPEPGQALPLLTTVLAVGVAATHGWGLCVLLAVLLGLGVLLIRWFGSTPLARVEPWLLRVPLAGRLLSQVAQLQIARTLAAQINCGVTLETALRQTGETTWSATWSDILARTRKSIQQGNSFSAALHEAGARNARMLLAMVALGDDTGDISRSLDMAVRLLEEDTDHVLQVLLQLLEPALIVAAGCITALVLVAALLPVYGSLASV